MSTYLSIGDFSRATHLTVKTLRHYHRIGLLAPLTVDGPSGYRRYSAEQIPTAQIIRRFRALDMPLQEIKTILAAQDPGVRGELIAVHLHRLEEELGRTQQAVAALRNLLTPPPAPSGVERRSVEAAPAAAITATVDADEAPAWLQGALGELYATITAQDLVVTGSAGGVYADELFTEHRGTATVFVPCAGPVRPLGRVAPFVVPAAELAIITHTGPPWEADRAYGTLAAYVAGHALAIDGPLREHYLIGQREAPDPRRWRTEIGWPIFRLSAG